MQRLLTFLILLDLASGCGSNNQPPETSTTSIPQTKPAKPDYTILRQDNQGPFTNFDILIDSTRLYPSEVMASGARFRAKVCGTLPCKVITIWDSQKAFALYLDQQEDAGWRKKNWPFICEHYVADYTVTVNELTLYPFMDSDYRKWGGQRNRPKKHSFAIL